MMHRSRGLTPFVALGLAVTVCVAAAGEPDPAHCTIPAYIDLGACDAFGRPDPTIFFSAVIRDADGVPVTGRVVSVEFGSSPGVCVDQDPVTPCQCFEATTDEYGVATWHVTGAGYGVNGTPVYICRDASYYAGGCGTGALVLGQSNVTVYDLNGCLTIRGVDITDLALWVSEYAQPMPPQCRGDYNHNGFIDIVDLALWVRVYVSRLSAYGCGVLCP